jgi:ATP synthase protein I
MSADDDSLRQALTRQIRRLREARRAGLVGVLLTGGTAGLLLVVPLVLGAYLGRWIDARATGYSVGWTVNLILLGLAIGAYNVYRFFKDQFK